MSFPLMNKRPRQAVVIPDLSGGMNLRDSVSMVQDNQLTECVNMYFRDGILKTRPGIENTEHFENEAVSGANLKVHDIFTEKDETCRLFTAKNESVIRFYWMGKNCYEELPVLETESESYFVALKDNELFCYAGKTYKYNISNSESEWTEIATDEFYVPIVSINHLPCTSESDPSEPTMLEGYNLLSNYYRMKASSTLKDGTKNEKGEEIGTAMMYRLLHRLVERDGEGAVIWSAKGNKITVEITYGDLVNGPDGNPLGVVKHEVEITSAIDSGKAIEEKAFQRDALRMVVNETTIWFVSEGTENEIAKEFKVYYQLNNMTITAPYHRDNNEHKVYDMTKATWFGGGSEGINGGTRLFLCGNTSEKNLVVWSDLNNPLYFPENNYFYVGESTSPVTAFGKQADMLVIFKSNETYYAQYKRNTEISSDAVMNQAVIDIASSSVYFPLILINATIGCDCPDTVQLCRNRLVWVNSNGRVYTLVSNNQYNERNVFEIGEMIHRKLKTEEGLKDARSVDWDGCYLLQTKRNIYVLDYNSYGFQYVSSYSKTEDANLRIPWYFWQLDLLAGKENTLKISEVDGTLISIHVGSYGIFKSVFADDCIYDLILRAVPETSRDYIVTPHPIKSEIQTKLFEFNAQGYYKNIDKVSLSLGNNGGIPIMVSFITDMGTEEAEITPDGEDTQAYSAGYVKSVQINPCIRQVERFGVKLSCDGPLAVDGITLTYRITGGVR